MAREIERKFLVRSEGWRSGARGVPCRQGYLVATPNCTVRVRILGERAFATIKGGTQGISRLEFEYPIPLADAEAMLDQLGPLPVIENRRYEVRYGGHKWEIDEFLGANEGLVLAEVELQAETEQPDLPDWAGQEVSLDPRYRNASLARNPYPRWAATSVANTSRQSRRVAVGFLVVAMISLLAAVIPLAKGQPVNATLLGAAVVWLVVGIAVGRKAGADVGSRP